MIALTATVKDIHNAMRCRQTLLGVDENATVAEAARRMTDNHVGALVVFDVTGRLAGVVTERDILAKVTNRHQPPQGLLVTQIMTTKPLACTPETPIEEVQRLMAEHNIRHLPVLENGKPVAMISSRDIIGYQLDSSSQMKTAAEQLALLSTELKNLSLDEVVALAVNEVPKSFQAGRAVLCLPKKDPNAEPVIHRRACDLPAADLFDPSRLQELQNAAKPYFRKPCENCKQLGCTNPALVIPLRIYNHPDRTRRHDPAAVASLCICCLQSYDAETEKLQLYKATLLQEMLSVNLTNAGLYQDYLRARRESEIDPLTNVGNRRILDNVLKTEFARSTRYDHPFCVAIVDLDNFKQINDRAGHGAGDRALAQVANLLRTNIRTPDSVVIRYGGDEFVLVLPETNLDNAAVLLNRLRTRINRISIPGFGPITVSCGIAGWAGDCDDDPEFIMNRADNALYRAKRAGKNRVEIAPPSPPVTANR